MPVALTPGANAPLPSARRLQVTLKAASGHADVICLLLDGDGRADGDDGVVLYSHPVSAGGAVRLDVPADRVDIELDALPAQVERVLVVAQADGTPDLAATSSLQVSVLADGLDAAHATFAPVPAFPTVQLVEVYRRAGAWKVRALGDGYAAGLARLLTVHGVEVDDDGTSAPSSGADVSAPGVDLRKPELPASGSVSLTKGQGVSLSKSGGALTQVTMGLGWDPAPSTRRFGGGGDIDLDASCVLLDSAGTEIDAVWFSQLVSRDGSIRHSGDNLTGEGEGDDESIAIDLQAVPAAAAHLVLTVNSYRSQGFRDVGNAFCRLLDDQGTEKARFDLTATGPHTGLVMAVLTRHAGGWELTACGDIGKGRTYRDMRKLIREVALRVATA